ncbi:hypothetical protein [Apibacter sp. HY039]|uniref:hypothetical protein n=1 Tax=Apibacter sp. HY039 TaxID=2501476 RepID=UPI000FEC069F|nr:hypothetical protein [Apibacter sp. HY039]
MIKPKEVETEEIIPVKISAKVSLNWNTITNTIERDSTYNTIKADKEKLKYLLNNIINEEKLNIKVCSKKEFLRKGYIAFIYLMRLNYIQPVQCLKLQFYTFESDCQYFLGLLDYIENNREDVSRRVNLCSNI